MFPGPPLAADPLFSPLASSLRDVSASFKGPVKRAVEIDTYSFIFFFGPGRALGFGPSTPAPRPLFDPVLGLEAFVVAFPVASLAVGCGVSEPGVTVGGEAASGLTWAGFDSSFCVGELAATSTSEVCFGGGRGEDTWLGVSGANRARSLLGSLRHTVLLGFDPLLVRVEVGGVETLARPLETRRIGLLFFEADGILSRCRPGLVSMTWYVQ